LGVIVHELFKNLKNSIVRAGNAQRKHIKHKCRNKMETNWEETKKEQEGLGITLCGRKLERALSG